MSKEKSILEQYRLSADELLEAENQLIPELAGTGDSCNPFKCTTSSPRNQMTDKFFTQKLDVLGSEPRRFYTGIEKQIGDYNVGATMPSDGTILRIIDVYKPKLGPNGLIESPETLVIYEEFENSEGIPGTIRSVLVKNYHVEHKTFGFKFKRNRFHKGDFLPEGYPLTTIPSISSEGQYCYGLEANTVFMSIPGVTEDGVIFSKSFAKRMTTTITGTAIVSYGDKYFPLNVNGTDEVFKPIPDIGDKIHPSGLLFALRPYNPLFDHIGLSKNRVGLKDVDYDNDRPYFGLPGATIIDVKITKKPEEEFSKIPNGMTEQTDRYFEQKLDYYKELLSFYSSISAKKKKDGERLLLGDELYVELEKATEYVGRNTRYVGGVLVSKKNIRYAYNKVPLDSIRIEIKYALEVPINEAYKATNCHGGKAVVVSVWDDDRMPIDADGNRAEVIMDDVSILKRINIGVFYEQFMGAVLIKTRTEIKNHMETGNVDKAWDRIELLYRIISPLMFRRVKETITTMARKREHIQSIINEGFYIYLPTHSPSMNNKMLKELKSNFPVCYGPIKYKSVDGREITTKRPILIGTNYMMLLNKIGDGWSAVTGAKLQHHGLPAKLNPSDRNLAPGRRNPVKFPAEAEVRSMVGASDTETAVDITDRSNNPIVNRSICMNILSSDNPSDIEDSADRVNNPYGGNRALRLTTHLLECKGLEFVYGED